MGKQQQSQSNGKLHHTIYSFVICCTILCECILIVYFLFFLPVHILKCFVLDVSGLRCDFLHFLRKYEICIAQSLFESVKLTSHNPNDTQFLNSTILQSKNIQNCFLIPSSLRHPSIH